MFDDSPATEPEDIFAPIDGGVPDKKISVPPAVEPARLARRVEAGRRPETEHEQILKNLEAGGDLTDFNQPPAASLFKKILVAVVVLAVLAIGAWAGWNYWQTRSGQADYAAKTETPAVNGLPEAGTTAGTEKPKNQKTEEPKNQERQEPAEVLITKDTDGDGLNDADEKTIGTDIKKPDTDSDGLSDRDEVEIYQTNPVNPDTDKDGVLDGVEVRKGDDPNGAGRLLELPVIE